MANIHDYHSGKSRGAITLPGEPWHHVVFAGGMAFALLLALALMFAPGGAH